MIEYRQIEEKDLQEVSLLLAQSFKAYCFCKEPLGRLFKEEEYYEAFLNQMFYVSTKANMKKYDVLVMLIDGKIVATLTLQSPNSKEVTTIDYIKSGVLSLLKWVSPFTILKYAEFNKAAARSCKRLKPNAWYLETFGVDVAYQGKGLGSKMINECATSYVKSHGSSEITLVTSSEDNCKFYAKNGFKQIEKEIIKYDQINIDNWSYYLQLNDKGCMQ